MKRTLTLSRETLSALTSEELSGLRGGAADTPTVLALCKTAGYTGLLQCYTGATTRYDA